MMVFISVEVFEDSNSSIVNSTGETLKNRIGPPLHSLDKMRLLILTLQFVSFVMGKFCL